MKLKKILHSFVAFATMMWFVGLLGLAPASVHAASAIAVTNGTYNANFSGSPIPASSPAMSIAKVSVTASQEGQTLTQVRVDLSGSGFSISDLASLTGNDSAGIILYNDDGAGSTGVFGSDDTFIPQYPPVWQESGFLILLPSTSPALTSGGATIFYVAIKQSGTIESGNTVLATIPVNGVVTSDGNGPAAVFASNYFRADTAPAQIDSVEGFSGSATLTVRFNKPVQKVGGGNLSYVGAGDPFTFTDGGGTEQAISSISHTAGQNVATITLNGALGAEDVDETPASIEAGSNKIADMGGNVIGTTAEDIASALTFDTSVLTTATAGTAYSLTLEAKGGSGSKTFSTNAAGDAAILTTVGLSLDSNSGILSGTPNNVPGSYQITFKVTDAVPATATRNYTLNVANASGAVPGITSVSPTGGSQGASALAVTVAGTNTSFSNSSTVEFLLAGVADSNITVSSKAAASVTSLGFNVAIAEIAEAGNRDVRITTDSQVVTRPNGFTVFSGSGSGLTLLSPTDAATNVQMPPGFNFLPSSNGSVASYRITMKSTSNFSGASLWDYAFPTGSTGHCASSPCSLSYGTGTFRSLTQPSAIAANTTYYWQVRTYSQAVASVSDDATPLESSLVRSFTTVSSVSDVTPPQIMFRPAGQFEAGADRTIFAKVTDNIATPTSTPALTTSVYGCVNSATCDPLEGGPVAGSYVGAGYWKFTIPGFFIDLIGPSGLRYAFLASDGTNTTIFRQSDGNPFTATAVDLADSHKLVGTVTDNAAACLAGVTVFAEGTAFNNVGSETSCAGGTYSLSGIPPGSYELTAFKEGYGERHMQGVSAIPTADSSPAYKFSLNSGNNGFRYLACNSINSEISTCHLYFSIKSNILLATTLKL